MFGNLINHIIWTNQAVWYGLALAVAVFLCIPYQLPAMPSSSVNNDTILPFLNE